MITPAWVLPLPSLTVQGSVGTSLSKPGAALFPAQLVSCIAQWGNRCFNAATISISCKGGSFIGHHDLAETLADAGFVAAAINHPGDTTSDMSRSGDLSVFIERPTDIKRLIDFMIDASPAASRIDPSRIGFFGFSRGGYTGLVLIGGNPDWAVAVDLCEQSSSHICDQIRGKEYIEPVHFAPRGSGVTRMI